MRLLATCILIALAGLLIPAGCFAFFKIARLASGHCQKRRAVKER